MYDSRLGVVNVVSFGFELLLTVRFVPGFQPIISVMSADETKYGNCETPEVTFQGAHNSNFLSETDKTARHEVQV
jgi:hypothetical protein